MNKHKGSLLYLIESQPNEYVVKLWSVLSLQQKKHVWNECSSERKEFIESIKKSEEEVSEVTGKLSSLLEAFFDYAELVLKDYGESESSESPDSQLMRIKGKVCNISSLINGIEPEDII